MFTVFFLGGAKSYTNLIPHFETEKAYGNNNGRVTLNLKILITKILIGGAKCIFISNNFSYFSGHCTSWCKIPSLLHNQLTQSLLICYNTLLASPMGITRWFFNTFVPHDIEWPLDPLPGVSIIVSYKLFGGGTRSEVAQS